MQFRFNIMLGNSKSDRESMRERYLQSVERHSEELQKEILWLEAENERLKVASAETKPTDSI